MTALTRVGRGLRHPRPPSARRGDPQPPVIVLGMHRSGTTVVTRLLRSAGLYVGVRTDRNHESLFFKQLDNWLLRKSGGSWERPEAIDDLLAATRTRGVVVEQLIRTLHSPYARHYLGWSGAARHARGQWLPFSWGWKDPRSTFTLPVWLDVFPDARVVNVERHGVDVAASLHARVLADAERADRRMERMRAPLLLGKGQLVALTGGVRGATPATALSLWASYAERAREHVGALGDRAVTVRYEELLANPVEEMASVLALAGLSESELDQSLLSALDPSRAFAYRARPELVALAESEARLLARFGY